jgi:hypothetical protein
MPIRKLEDERIIEVVHRSRLGGDSAKHGPGRAVVRRQHRREHRSAVVEGGVGIEDVAADEARRTQVRPSAYRNGAADERGRRLGWPGC